jgi:hypothetical protein
VNNHPLLADVGISFLILGIRVSFIRTQGEFKVGMYQLVDPGYRCRYVADPECVTPQFLKIFPGVKCRVCYMVDFFI